MAMKVEIVSRELIKPPPSSTPQSGTQHKLSLLDQIAPHGYNPIVLFYSAALSEIDFQKTCDDLRVSLLKTLSYVRPLAGRVKDSFTIECNDNGVDLVVANVFEDMSSVLDHPKTQLLRQLLPVNPETIHFSLELALLMVQINRFTCGGLVLGLCISHVVADAMSMTTFLTTWARINQHEKEAIADGFRVLDCTSLFPPRDVDGFSLIPLSSSPSRVSTRRIVFDGSKIASLQERTTTVRGGRPPSRVEAVSALVWEAVVVAFQKTKPSIKAHIMINAIDLRGKIKPPLPLESVGNIFFITEATCEVKDEASVPYDSLVERVRESMLRAKKSSFTPTFFGDEFLNAVRSGVETMRKSDEIGLFMTSSICRFPVYEIDFGFGKPEWIGNGIRAMNVCILSDTKNGHGIEAFLGLAEEHMHLVENNPNFIAYVSSIQPV